MIKANEYIFGTLANFIREKDTATAIPNNKYCIDTNDQEKEWLQELKILDVQPILPNFKTASFEFKGDKYFVTVGQSFELKTEECIQLVDSNAGSITALLSELQVAVIPQTSEYQIANSIFYEQQEKIIRHPSELVAAFFEPIRIYKIEDDSPFNVDNEISIMRASGFYIVKACQLISLRFSSQTLLRFEKLFVEGSNSVPYESLLFSLVSVHWKYSFLDAYRCIERLFCLSALKEFHKRLSISNSLLEFSMDVENYTGWKPKENDALNKLINDSPNEVLMLLKRVKEQIDGSEEGKCGDFVYKVRNSIVHFRPATEQLRLTDDCWDTLIESCLLIIIHWYQEFNDEPCLG